MKKEIVITHIITTYGFDKDTAIECVEDAEFNDGINEGNSLLDMAEYLAEFNFNGIKQKG